MTWRRFTQGNFGALSAKQYTDVQDTVAALARRSGVSTATAGGARTHLLARLKDKFGASTEGAGSVAGSSRIRAQAYNFAQVFVRVSDSGGVEVAERGYGLSSDPAEGAPETQRLLAIDFAGTDYAEDTIVMLMPIPVDGGDSLTQVPARQSLYAIIPTSAPVSIGVYVVLAAMPGGMYSVRADDDTSGATQTMENLYETSDYYGALLGVQNPCATLTPGRLGPGDRVFGFTYGGTLVTCAPTPFSVVCQPCGGVAQSIEALYDADGAEAAVASRMLGG
jgi:hypothetical protein